MSYSIIVLNYNNSKDTIDLVERVSKYYYLDHVIIVDNNSSESQCHLLNKYIKNVKNKKIYFFKSTKNSGYASGNNVGLNILERDLKYEGVVVVMNPDVMILEEDLDRVVSRCQELPPTILAPKIIKGKSWWKFTSYKNTILEDFLHIKTNRDDNDMLQSNNELKQVDVLSGAILVANMSTWSEIGYFDENTFLYFEEEILQYKAHKMGVKSFLVCDSYYQHEGGTSTNTNNKKNSFKSILSHEWRVQKSREYYFSHYLGIKQLKLGLLRLLFFTYTPLIIIKRKFTEER